MLKMKMSMWSQYSQLRFLRRQRLRYIKIYKAHGGLCQKLSHPTAWLIQFERLHMVEQRVADMQRFMTNLNAGRQCAHS